MALFQCRESVVMLQGMKAIGEMILELVSWEQGLDLLRQNLTKTATTTQTERMRLTLRTRKLDLYPSNLSRENFESGTISTCRMQIKQRITVMTMVTARAMFLLLKAKYRRRILFRSSFRIKPSNRNQNNVLLISTRKIF